MNKRYSFKIDRCTGRPPIWTILAVALLLTIATPAQSQDDPNLSVVPPDAHPFGMSLGEWSVRWWQWLIMLPNSAPDPTSSHDASPFNWPTTNDCSTAQVGTVWFLVGLSGPNTVTITCDIPAGKALFFPIINVECSNLEQAPFFGHTPKDRRMCAENDLKGTRNLVATVDGKPIRNLTSFRAPSADFDFAVPPDNILSIPGHTVPGSFGQSGADGFYLMLAPLSGGKHTIHFAGEVVNTDLGDFKIDTTYKLTVDKDR